MSAVPSTDNALPRLLAGRFELRGEVGHGGYARVYRAWDRTSLREVAVKMLRSDSLPASALERFQREMEIAGGLVHPNIVRAIDVGIHEGLSYFVMDYVDGPTLESRLAREGALPVEDALEIARQVGDALSYAHSRGVIHRDVKPANILLSDGNAYLGDFGIARLLADTAGERITSTGLAVGTMLYMSPEQLCAEPTIDARADQYALALVCHEMLTGVVAHTAGNTDALRALRLSGAYVSVRQHRAAVSEAADSAIARALRPSPADRFRDVRTFVAALSDGRHTGVLPGTSRQRVTRAVAVAGTVAVLAVAAGAAWMRARAPFDAREQAPHVAELMKTNRHAASLYQGAWTQLMGGQLDSAQQAFAATTRAAGDFVPARFWLAQAGAWADPTRPERWRDAALSASKLRGEDSLLAEALVAMSNDDPPRACRLYREQLDHQPDSFAAWFGLGECQRLDSVVVGEPGKRMHFRSSHWSSFRSYRSALEHLPSARLSALFERVLAISYATESRARVGTAAGGTTFIAFPSYEGDSIALWPIRSDSLLRTAVGSLPESYSRAVSRGRASQLDFTRRWVDLAPASALAWYSHANALELADMLDAPDIFNSAGSSLRRADSLTVDPVLQARIDVARVRVAARRDSLPLAERLARAALRRASLPSPQVARLRAPLAAFLGDADATVALLHLASSSEAERRHLPAWAASAVGGWLADSLRSLGVRAAIGMCDGLPERSAQVEEALRLEVAPADLARQRETLLHEIYRLAAPCTGPALVATLPARVPFDAAAIALSRGQRATARAEVNALSKARRGTSVGALSQDALLVETWLQRQLGDSASVHDLRAADAHGTNALNPFTFNEVTQAAAFGRLHRSLVTPGSP